MSLMSDCHNKRPFLSLASGSFLREARAIAMLDHPHILQLFDYGQGQVDGLELVYLVMPYRPEGSLSTWLRQRNAAGLGRIAPQEAARLIGQAASALQHA